MAKANKRGRGIEMAAKERSGQSDQVWKSCKHLFDPAIRNHVDTIASAGGLNSTELKNLVTATMIELMVVQRETGEDKSKEILSAQRLLWRIMHESGDKSSADIIQVEIPRALRAITTIDDEGDEI